MIAPRRRDVLFGRLHHIYILYQYRCVRRSLFVIGANVVDAAGWLACVLRVRVCARACLVVVCALFVYAYM